MKHNGTFDDALCEAGPVLKYLVRVLVLLSLLTSFLLAGSCSLGPDSGNSPATYSIGLVLPSESQSVEPVRRGLDIFLNDYRTTLSRQLSKEFGIAAPNIVFHSVAPTDPEASGQMPYEKAATRMAQSLIRERNSVALIGNPTADDEHVDHTFYNENKVPLIALASSETDVTRNSPWVFSMIYNDEWQGALISAYAKEILKVGRVVVMRAEYMLGLGESFARHSETDGLTIAATITFNAAKDLSEDRLARQLQEIPAGYDAVILLAHAKDALDMVRLISSAGVRVPIVGPDDLSGEGFVTGVRRIPADTLPKRIIVANPFFFELAPLKASDFVQEYRHRYRDEDPNQSSVYAYDAAYLIARGLMEGLRQGKTGTSQLRESIKDYLLSILSMDNAIDGISGRLYFDEQGAMRRPVLFSRLKDGKFFPEYTQLLPVRRVRDEQSHGVESAKHDEQWPEPILVDGVQMKKVAVVYAGIDVEQVRNINLDAQQFEMQGFLWLKWREHIPWIEKHKFFWNQILGSGEGVVSLGRRMKSPTKYASFELRSQFEADYDLRQFPFDTQTLTLDLSAAKLGVDEALFVIDRSHLRSTEDILASKKALPPGYKLLGIEHFSGTKPFASSLGKVKLSHAGPDHSVYRVSLLIQRRPFPYFLKVFVPLFILMGVSLAVFLIPVQGSFSVRMSLAATALLSAIVLHLSRTQSLPNVNYLTRIDYYFVFAYLFMGTTIVASIYKERLSRRDALHVAAAVNRTVGLILLVGAIGVFGLLSVPGLSEIWPALVVMVTMLSTLVCSSRLAYVQKKTRKQKTTA